MSNAGTLIRAQRIKFGMDQTDLAKLAGVSPTTLRAVENGSRARTGTIGRIQRALDRYDAETSAPPAPPAEPRTMTYHVVVDDFGPDGSTLTRRVDVTLDGPMDSADELRESVRLVLADLRRPSSRK